MKDIPIHLDRLIGAEAASRLRSSGLDKIASAMLKDQGFKVGEELTMKDVITALGTKLRQKNAEYQRIFAGIEALKKIEE